jgi:Inner membrane component of T3SS, cytoplasmic domain
MPFVDWPSLVRASVFGGVFIVPLFAVLWLWYDSSGRADTARWYWRLILTALVVLTMPAVVLGAANLDVSQQDLMRVCGWLAIGSGGIALLGVLAYAIWGRVSSEEMPDDELDDYAPGTGQPFAPIEPPTLTSPETMTMPGQAFQVSTPPAPPAPPAPSGPVGAYMFVKSGSDKGRQFAVGNQVTIGRGTNCGIRLDDSRISSEHAQLKREGSSYVYLDLKSTNGSFLIVEGREERLRSSQALVDGDEVRVGQTVLKFIRVQEGSKR